MVFSGGWGGDGHSSLTLHVPTLARHLLLLHGLDTPDHEEESVVGRPRVRRLRWRDALNGRIATELDASPNFFRFHLGFRHDVEAELVPHRVVSDAGQGRGDPVALLSVVRLGCVGIGETAIFRGAVVPEPSPGSSVAGRLILGPGDVHPVVGALLLLRLL